MARLFLIDGNNQMYRAYHAIHGLTAPDGKSTNAVYGFVTMLRKLIADHAPDHLAASFDLAGPTFRDDLAADYKANRAPMPTDLVEQVPLVHESCEALGVPILNVAGFEADDVIGTLAVQAHAAGYEVAIVTGDKDFFQLVRDGIRIFNPKDDATWYDAAGVVEKFGVRPEQVVDVLALMGDSVDNIKGVPGIGEKGARDLISTYGSLDALLENAASVPNRRQRDALMRHVAEADASRELARIRTDVPVTFDAEALRYRGPSSERCFALFSSLGFRSFTSEFAPTAASSSRDYRLIGTIDEVAELAATLRPSGRFSLAVIADGTSAVRADVIGLSFSTAPATGCYIPIGHTGLSETPNLPIAGVIEHLKSVLEDASIAKIGHDLKFAAIALARHGVILAGVDLDTMIASYVVDATKSGHTIEELAIERTNYRAISEDDVRGRGAKASALADIPAVSLLDFAAERADLPMRLATGIAVDLSREKLEHIYREFEQPLIAVLASIEESGVKVDVAALAAQSTLMEAELGELSRQIFVMSGGEFNINSPKQLSDVLFTRLNLTAGKKTGKTKATSTAVDVLEELALEHEMPRLVLQWRRVMKLKGTYVDALPLLVNPMTGRVHTTFNQAVAATGRLSSSDPNLQNIPIRTATGREIRGAFVAEPGYRLISADYSQIELRVLAHLSGDEALIEAFQRGEDIHDRTAERVFGGAASGLDTHELRRRAKIINYALLYGKTAFTLAKDIGVPQQAAQEFINAYFAGFPGVRVFIDKTLEDARLSGVVKTLSGRRRLVPELTSRNGQIRAAAEREAVNMPIQGTAADVLKKAMIDTHAALVARNAGRTAQSRMILTVHDELLFEVPEDDTDEVAALVRHSMEHAFTLNVPLTVDVGVGINWKEAKP